MSLPRFTRRRFLSASACTALAATSRPLFAQQTPYAQHPTPAPSMPATTPLDEKLDAYIASYMPAMNAPGMTLGLTDSTKTLRNVGYGYASIDLKLPVTPDHLFQIASITKSFVALVLMQLRDEGKLDVHKPVLDYLPWLPIAEPFGPITVHHLLTHTSGLPDASDVFLTAPEARHIQGFAPGEHFHYCNLGFAMLGHLATQLDGRPWYECVKARIFTPLEMRDTEGVIATTARPRAAIGYEPFWDGQAYPRQGQLAVADYLVMDDTAGCIESTPADMAKYLRMMLNHGKTQTGSAVPRIVSAESFSLFSTPYIKAEEFSPTASYGYGIAVDTLDGHKILRHTGGMIAFASSIHVDLDGEVAAFASINAMQGYRPTAVTQYAVRLLRAQSEAKPPPAAEPLQNPEVIQNADDYVGSYKAEDGSELVFRKESGQTAQGRPKERNSRCWSTERQSHSKRTAETASFRPFPASSRTTASSSGGKKSRQTRRTRSPLRLEKSFRSATGPSGMQAKTIPPREPFLSRTTTRHSSGTIAASRFGAETCASLCFREDWSSRTQPSPASAATSSASATNPGIPTPWNSSPSSTARRA